MTSWFIKSPGTLVKALGAAVGGVCLCIDIALNWNKDNGNNRNRDNNRRNRDNYRPDRRNPNPYQVHIH